MTSAEDLHVDPADFAVMVEWLRAEGADDDLDEWLRITLGADERALAYAGSHAAVLAARYRVTREPGLLDQLRARGHEHIVGRLEFEQPREGDSAAARHARAGIRELVDNWIATDPPDPWTGPLEYRLGSPTG